MAAVFWFACPNPGYALEYFIETKADMDSIRLVFDQKNLSGKVARTGRQQITIFFPANALKGEKQPTPAPLSSLRLVNSLKMGPSSITIGTRTSAFGFIRMPAGNGQMMIQFFRDPIGAKWRSPEEKARREAERKKAAQKKIADQKKTEAKRAADTKAKAEALRVASENKAAPKTEVKPPQPPVIDEIDLPEDKESPQLKQELEQAAEETPVEQIPPQPVKRPFYSVPYTYRAPVANVGPGQAKPVDTSVPPARAGGSARRVVDDGESGGQVVARIEPESSGGSAGGSIAPPPADEAIDEGVDEGVDEASGDGAAVEGVAYEEKFPEGKGASGSVTPPQQSEGSASGSVSGRIAPPPSQTGGQVSGSVSGQVSGKISPPASAVSGQVTPPPDNEDSFEGADSTPLEDQGAVENAVEADNRTGARDEAVEGEQDASASDAYPVGDSEQLDEGGEEGAGGEGEKEMSPEDRIKVAKGVLLAAEGALDEGEIEAAIAGFTEVSLMKELPMDMRLRALYGKAEGLTELHRAAMAENFGKIASAWMEAMNADTKSPNVPMALLNLGLLNLKVGNMPEAKAYFNLLKSQYPNDPNIPYISYYWGEYYLGMKEYEKAADQFQYLVQMFPDSKIVRDAALGLAKSLDALGYDEQAFQIIDYIDKRWPRFYIEDLRFLLMSANTQNRLGKIEEARENYWAYYNLSPEAPEADIVLARIGDIYLKTGQKTAAKEIYEKAAKDFPDKEGGLVSMMRLAEEGIYDDPSMSQMDKVFDRPYNLRPQKIYTHIIEKFPDSQLAPLAQLKLGMWYYWNKKYGDCLGAVQAFLDKYPRSGLRDRASELGTRVFDMAVPELVKDENYGRVVDYWNKYAQKNNEGKDVNDETRLGVALSFWKKELPARALELIDRYLQGEEIPKYSAMALDMALGIYVDEQAWSKVTELVDLAKDKWKLDPKQKVHIEYAQAMAYENLGETERSTPLWAGLASNLLLPESSRAYAMYYMAKSSMKKKELKKVFVYAQEALAMLLETGGDREKIKDCILMTIFAAESSGRYREALKWAAEYDKYIPLSDPEWASSRFRLAQLYEKAGAVSEWKKLMEEVAKQKPGDLYGRLATSALATHKIEQDALKFQPAQSFQ
ncbi:tetratricopeptide repeat protein [Maridesulfovibrio sp.]|uniref:tetratricopeptide repeat protein n=1 Tax=Maridesulfovibrio sp. TaxID=2795000 RepID=UPI002A18D548|nr:tetratricopeptide repeat protein [Maridesulfovibrio sp.]